MKRNALSKKITRKRRKPIQRHSRQLRIWKFVQHRPVGRGEGRRRRTNTPLFPFLRDATRIVHYSICMGKRGEHKTIPNSGKIEQLVANFQQPIIVFEVGPCSRSVRGYRLSIPFRRPGSARFYFRITIIIVNGQMARYIATCGRLQFRFHGQSSARVFRFYFHRTS